MNSYSKVSESSVVAVEHLGYKLKFRWTDVLTVMDIEMEGFIWLYTTLIGAFGVVDDFVMDPASVVDVVACGSRGRRSRWAVWSCVDVYRVQMDYRCGRGPHVL